MDSEKVVLIVVVAAVPCSLAATTTVCFTLEVLGNTKNRLEGTIYLT
jgi:hypothetical protein